MSKIIKLITITFLCFVFSNSYSQDKTIDSLQNILNSNTKRDTIRVNLLNNLANKIGANDAEKALKLFNESVIIADELNYKKGKAYSLFNSGKTQINIADYSGSINYLQNALTVYEELKDKEGLANSYLSLGKAYYYSHDFQKALENFKNSSSISEEIGKVKILSNSLMVTGMIYCAQGDYDKGLEHYKRAVQIDEKSGNKKGLSAVLINLANLYKQQGDYTLALESYNKSLEIKKQLNDEYGIASNYNNIGTLYQEMENNKEALTYYNKALPIFEKLNNSNEALGCLSNIGIILMYDKNPKALTTFNKALRLSKKINNLAIYSLVTANIGGYYFLNNDFDESLHYYEKAVKIQKQLDAKRELSYSYLNIGRIYYAKKEYDKALQVTKEGMNIAKKLNLLNYQTDFSLLLSEIYYSTKEYKLAYENSQAHKKLNDSIYKKENYDKLAQIKFKYAYKDTLNSANKNVSFLKKTVQTIHEQRKWLIIGFISLLLALGFVIALLKIRKIKMQNQQLLLEQKLLITQMNPHFIFNSIDNIQSLIYNKQDNEAINYLNKFSKLTRQILENSTENYISLNEELDMIENYLVIQQLLYNNKFDYQLTVEDKIDTEALLLPPMLTQPFIENAIKHGLNNKTEKGKIDINFYLKEDKLFFNVTDNGTGFDTSKKTENHKSLAMSITKERLVNYTKNQNFVVQTDNIIDDNGNSVGAKVVFEIPYIYEK